MSPSASRPALGEDRPGRLLLAGAVVGAIAVATAIVVPLRDVAPSVSLGVLYLLAVVGVASWLGLWPGVAAALLGAGAYNWFLIDPTGRFTVADTQDWYALGIFLVVAVTASTLAQRARSRLRVAELRRQEANLAEAAARELLGDGPLALRLDRTSRRVAAAAGADSVAIVPGEREAPAGELAIELAGPRGRTGTLLVPAALPEGIQRRLRQRVAPALGALLATALERDRLAAEVLETEALRRSDTLKTALLRAVSHDLRSPLTAIVAAGDALRSATLGDADRTELADVVVEEGRRLEGVIEKLLDLSKLQAGSAEPRADWVEVGELLHAAAEEVERREAPGAPAFTFAIQDDLPLVRSDPAQLERVFENLLENAQRHSAGKPVSVRARATTTRPRRLVVRVVDQGPGIPPEAQRHVFEPFYRVGGEAPSAAAGGSGLGLAIAKGFVEVNGGRIAVESVPGQGTSMVVDLPIPDGPGAG